MCKVLIAVGGTGGHLFPAQQLVNALKQSGIEGGAPLEIVFGGHKLLSNPFFTDRNFPCQEIVSSAPKRGNLGRFFKDVWKGFWQSMALIRSFRPDVVVGFGSYHTFTLLLAAVVLRKKILLFEGNSILGKVNWLFSPFASRVALQLPLYRKTQLEPLKKNQVFVNYFPWNKKSQTDLSRQQARLFYGLDPNCTTILVFGGSQGASFFNEQVPKAIERLFFEFPLQVIHLTGKGDAVYRGLPCLVKPFETQMERAYAACDVVICRSGAATLGEIITYRKKALLIPFPWASDNHQKINAHFLVQNFTGAFMLSQDKATPLSIAEGLRPLLCSSSDLTFLGKQIDRRSLDDIVLEVGRW